MTKKSQNLRNNSAKEKAAEMPRRTAQEPEVAQNANSLPTREPGVSAIPPARPMDSEREGYHDYHMDEQGNVVHTPQ